MQLLSRSCRSFSLNFTALKPEVTTTGRHNYNIYANPTINGYLTNNSQNNMHTVIMIHEWWGFNESITRTAETFSNTNIRVFVPDLFRSEAANSAEVNQPRNSKLATRCRDLTGPRPSMSSTASGSTSNPAVAV